MKHGQKGMEYRWNRYGEPFSQYCDHKTITTWLNRKITRAERRYGMSK